ncbi:Acetyltransferase (GNAT) family [Nesidiocoris tenuis]|uniref:Acetyltransferase (GNAT) family n=1 Tax=Nesidiocoris tenuis TaxID=355587 RepID=A0ABN7AJD2_9HEMI|nr:Acetyltransferase (GNAT) family [Nesidiocoris tenuis]
MIIRKVTSADTEQLTNLVREWIAGQTLFPPVDESFDFADLLRESDSLYYCVVAEDEEKKAMVGYALCTYNYAIWVGKSVMLENIFVKENYRRRGIGTRLLAAIHQHASEKGCLQVNFLTTNADKCEGFFKKIGARDLTDSEGWLMYTLSRENMIATEKYLPK